jgi:hypothetical protein
MSAAVPVVQALCASAADVAPNRNAAETMIFFAFIDFSWL